VLYPASYLPDQAQDGQTHKFLTFCSIKTAWDMRMVTDDGVLWQSLKNGDHDSFQAIYFSHFDSLYSYGLRIAGDRDLVKDCIHDLFVKIWTNKSGLADVTAIRSYLLVSLRSTLFNRLQQMKRVTMAAVHEQHPFDLVFSAESDFIRKEEHLLQSQKLLEALNQLSPRQKEVIYLRYFEELGYEEIAGIMNITVKATYKLTARGLETLRQVLHLPPFLLLMLIGYARAGANS
jgi:RNA polymerase sigma factor (sigma-70 family)